MGGVPLIEPIIPSDTFKTIFNILEAMLLLKTNSKNVPAEMFYIIRSVNSVPVDHNINSRLIRN